MKYKKQLATGALALSLFLSGSTIYATGFQDLGVKNVKTYQKQNKNATAMKKKNNIVGTVGSFTSTGFTVNVINMRTKATSSVDVSTSTITVYKKDGLAATTADLMVGGKVIVSGTLDKTTNVLAAKTVKIVTKTLIAKAKNEMRKELKKGTMSTGSAKNTTTKTN